jgi:hypothetical protein
MSIKNNVSSFLTRSGLKGYIAHNYRFNSDEEENEYNSKCGRLGLQSDWFCGYVGIPIDSPFWLIPYNAKIRVTWAKNKEIKFNGFENIQSGEFRLESILDCHGGLTFSDDQMSQFSLGFDRDHDGDGGITEEYVKYDVENLAVQIKKYSDFIKENAVDLIFETTYHVSRSKWTDEEYLDRIKPLEYIDHNPKHFYW